MTTPRILAGTLLVLGLMALAPDVHAGPVGSNNKKYTKVHLEKEDALAHVFPDAERIVEMRHILSSRELAGIEKRTRRRLEEGGFYIYAGLVGDEPIGYAVIVSQIGKVLPITHIVEVTPEGTTGQVAVMIYRESHGDEVARERFMEQFLGLGLDDPIRIDRDIINIAGATLSGNAICSGVRKALAVVEQVVFQRDADARRELLATGVDVTPAELMDRNGRLAATDQGSLRIEREVMGTICTIEAWPESDGPSGEALAAALEDALDEVARWDAILSNWQDDTPLSRLNRADVGAASPLDPDLQAWLVDATTWSARTDGAFDPAVGSLVHAWGLMSREPARPAADVLEAARRDAGLDRFDLDPTRGTATRRGAGAQLDPGASGKGFALDHAAERLRDHGVRRALLSFRSTLLALGPPPGQAGWVVPIVHDGLDRQVTTITLVDQALSVSGGSMRAFVDEGVDRGHVINPQTGVPVEADRLAWAVHDSASASDALATALLVRGPLLGEIDDAQGGFLATPTSQPVSWPAHP